VSRIEELFNANAADVSGAPGNEDVHVVALRFALILPGFPLVSRAVEAGD
jgi:hypothetical protein